LHFYIAKNLTFTVVYIAKITAVSSALPKAWKVRIRGNRLENKFIKRDFARISG
jgi:hypothetical protein